MGASKELLPPLVTPLSHSPKVVERGHAPVPSPPSTFGAPVTRLSRERAISSFSIAASARAASAACSACVACGATAAAGCGGAVCCRISSAEAV